MKVLFICNQNENRSKTAEELFKSSFETRSAGLYNDHPLSEEQFAWAELVVVMEDGQRKELGKRFPKLYLQKKIINLEIPDVYGHRDPELILLLQEKMPVYIKEEFILS